MGEWDFEGVKFSVEEEGELVVVWARPGDWETYRRAVMKLEELGLVEGLHFTARDPPEGYIRITMRGLVYIGWLARGG
jgi:hypothetical protein